ncbi:MAG: hypothetical protein L0099_00980 [Acidobacteria bacterium]|nr:hypothetical protein [Acidobacteriota bacterium]
MDTGRILGLLLLGAGVWWWLRERDTVPTAVASTPSLPQALTPESPTGAYILFDGGGRIALQVVPYVSPNFEDTIESRRAVLFDLVQLI